MNFKEIVLNKLYDSPLFSLTEQSKQRYNAEQEVTGLGGEICLHILKCLIYGPKCDALPHWQNEINNWLYKIMKITLKPKRKLLSLRDILLWGTECLCDESKPSEKSFIGTINFLKTDSRINEAVGLDLVTSSFLDILELIKQCYTNARNGEYTINKLCEDWFQKHKDVYYNNTGRQ